MNKRGRIPTRGKNVSKTPSKDRRRALVHLRPWIQVKVANANQDTKSAQVSFQRDHEAISKMPPWYQRMEAEKRTDQEVVREAAKRLQRAPSHDNYVIFGLLINRLGKAQGGGRIVTELLTRDFFQSLRRTK